MPADELPFGIDWLASAHEKKSAVSVCDLGHLVVNGRTHWQPVRLAGDLSAVWFQFVEHQEAM